MAEVIYSVVGTDFTAIHLGVVALGFVLALVVFLKARVWKSELAKLQDMFNEMDEEKTKYYDRSGDMEAENKDLKEKIRLTNVKYEEEKEKLMERERSLEDGSKSVEDGLMKISAMKDSLDHHRTRIGEQQKEKDKLADEIRSLKNQLTDISSRHKSELSSQRSVSEAKIAEIKGKTKDIVKEFTGEKEERLRAIEEENAELKKTNDKLKERLGLWESVGDL